MSQGLNYRPQTSDNNLAVLMNMGRKLAHLVCSLVGGVPWSATVNPGGTRKGRGHGEGVAV